MEAARQRVSVAKASCLEKLALLREKVTASEETLKWLAGTGEQLRVMLTQEGPDMGPYIETSLEAAAADAAKETAALEAMRVEVEKVASQITSFDRLLSVGTDAR